MPPGIAIRPPAASDDPASLDVAASPQEELLPLIRALAGRADVLLLTAIAGNETLAMSPPRAAASPAARNPSRCSGRSRWRRRASAGASAPRRCGTGCAGWRPRAWRASLSSAIRPIAAASASAQTRPSRRPIRCPMRGGRHGRGWTSMPPPRASPAGSTCRYPGGTRLFGGREGLPEVRGRGAFPGIPCRRTGGHRGKDITGGVHLRGARRPARPKHRRWRAGQFDPRRVARPVAEGEDHPVDQRPGVLEHRGVALGAERLRQARDLRSVDLGHVGMPCRRGRDLASDLGTESIAARPQSVALLRQVRRLRPVGDRLDRVCELALHRAQFLLPPGTLPAGARTNRLLSPPSARQSAVPRRASSLGVRYPARTAPQRRSPLLAHGGH